MVSIPVPLQFPVPPYRFTTLEALPGNPYNGPGFFTLTRTRGPVPVDAFGIAWQAFAPSGFGYQNWTVKTFEAPVGEILVVKENLLGVTANGQVVELFQDEGYILFDEYPNVKQVTVYVIAAASVNFHWVLVL